MSLLIVAALLGLVEGLTEFLPVSSTGHLILATKFFGYDEAQWAVFNIVIQLPAIMAVVVLYWGRFMEVLRGLFGRDVSAYRFVGNILLAFMPSAVLGVLLKKRIDALLERPDVVAVALIVGGIAILIIERFAKQGEYQDVATLTPAKVIGVGFMQCLAMIPGVSRSGATIMGAMCMGLNRRTAAELSFFLAIPTMLGATAKQVWDNRHELASGATGVGLPEIAIGSIVSFVVALVVIKGFVSYISRRGFTPFAVYRILAGGVALYFLSHMG
ncbi:undecaprenyl-diphosphate phosphatase [Novosphingobium sp. FSY-8]|uniref:Undecaprenyl-diphosphatase n=1 Tax=Novosphingobium ovatum TaxID=1908523 RepID=A0ABW9XGT4_9SPHN|nr:undecaprenyl-diphosphate phosphatase [Novosphingobium ovatum]NBC37622.1 undecaprenyl-diphosphate phosphatase [Novosphingobium ovatum]